MEKRDPAARLLTLATAFALVAIVGTEPGVTAKTKEPAQPAQPYRFVIAGAKGKPAIRGLITVDDKDRLIERADTPFEFHCEAGSVISGYFEAVDAGQILKLEVFDPVVSKKKPALVYALNDRFRFSWAQAGVGPRCADFGEGSCPETTPSIDAFKSKLAALQKAK